MTYPNRNIYKIKLSNTSIHVPVAYIFSIGWTTELQFIWSQQKTLYITQYF